MAAGSSLVMLVRAAIIPSHVVGIPSAAPVNGSGLLLLQSGSLGAGVQSFKSVLPNSRVPTAKKCMTAINAAAPSQPSPLGTNHTLDTHETLPWAFRLKMTRNAE